MLAAVTFLFIIQIPAATGVNIVNMIIVNCLTINFIFSFTNKYVYTSQIIKTENSNIVSI